MPRLRGAIGAGLGAGVAAAALAAGALAWRVAQGGFPDPSAELWLYAEVAGALVYGLTGGLIAHRLRGAHQAIIGWLFVAVAWSFAISAFAAEYGSHALYQAPGSLPLGAWISSLQGWAWRPGNVLVAAVIPVVLPTGRPASWRWAAVPWAGAAVLLLTLPAGITNPWPWPDGPPESPLAVTDPAWRGPMSVASTVGEAALGALAVAGAASLLARRRRAGADERPALGWLAVGASVAAAAALIGGVHPLGDLVPRPNVVLPVLSLVALPFLPVAALVAILRHRLWGIEVVLNRALVWGLLTAGLVAGYVAVVAAVDAVWQSNLGPSLLATAAVAVLFAPARQRLQLSVDRLMYGERHDPAALLRAVGRRLEAASPGALLGAVAAEVSEGLRLDWVAVDAASADGWKRLAEHGRAPLGDLFEVPLVHQGTVVGRLLAAGAGDPRSSPGAGPGGGAPSRARDALVDLAGSVGTAVHAARLATELQRSRGRLVTAREEERRRLRRQLHDGVGPTMAGVAMGLRAVRNRMAGDAEATRLLDRLAHEIEECVNDVRGLVYDLRPASLDEFGLVGALDELAARWRLEGGLDVAVDAEPDVIADLPAAVEVATYRIAVEALTNAGRHSRARRCSVALRLDGALEVEVHDDGTGLPAGHRAGVGMTAMRERAEELGGCLSVESGPGHGTRVLARLPVEGAP